MELRKGYKYTEIGVIPCDWDVLVLKNVLNGIADVDHYMPQTTKIGIPYIMTGDLKELVSEIDFDNCKQISLSDYKLLSKKIKNSKGDIILARYATIGTVSYVDINFDFVVSYSCVTIKPNTTKLLGVFLFNYFKSTAFRIEVSNIINTGTQANVGIGDLYTMKIALPPFTEQTVIANALSDADALISSLEKLIEKKRNIKQGAMQQLLKPKKGWVVKKLVEVGNCYAGGTPSTFNAAYWNGNIIWLPSGRVQNNILKKLENEITITKMGLEESSAKLIKRNSVLIAITGATCGNIGLLQFEATANQSVVAIEPNDQFDYLFLFYLLLNNRNIILSNQTGSAQGGVNLKTIKNIEFHYPNNKTEQCDISMKLYDMDNEIASLEKKLSKRKMLKQGMMQELLTGKIRLV